MYTAGALLLLERYLDAHNIGDATDASARWIMEYYQHKRANLLMSDARDEEEKLKFVPRLMKKDGELSVSFKVGEGKLFVVKNWMSFAKTSNIRRWAFMEAPRRFIMTSNALRNKRRGGSALSTVSCARKKSSCNG